MFLCISFYYVTFTKLYFIDGDTVPFVNLNTEEEKEQDLISTDEEIFEHCGQTFNDSNPSNSPTQTYVTIYMYQAHQRKLKKHQIHFH